MRIAIEEPMQGGGKGGVSVYVRNILRELLRLAPENDYILFGFFFRSYQEKLSRVKMPNHPRFSPLFPRWPESWVSRLEWGWGVPWIEGYLKWKGVDLFHAFRAPRRHCLKTVVTVHDLFPVVHPEWTTPYLIDLYKTVLRPHLKNADRVIAISQNTKKDLVERWGVSPQQIEVIYEGVDLETFKPMPPQEISSLKDKYKLPQRFFLMIGPFDLWCDPFLALEAVSKLPPSFSDVGVVLAGQPGNCRENVERRVADLGFESRVLWTGYVSQFDLVGLYNLAEGLVYPSFYEGFGLPVLEAMACGTPVITSNVTSLPEVAGDAAILVDPSNVEDLKASLQRLLEEPSLKDSLREKGIRRAATFTWESAALKTLEVYRSIKG